MFRKKFRVGLSILREVSIALIPAVMALFCVYYFAFALLSTPATHGVLKLILACSAVFLILIFQPLLLVFEGLVAGSDSKLQERKENTKAWLESLEIPEELGPEATRLTKALSATDLSPIELGVLLAQVKDLEETVRSTATPRSNHPVPSQAELVSATNLPLPSSRSMPENNEKVVQLHRPS